MATPTSALGRRETRAHPPCGARRATVGRTLNALGLASSTFYRWYAQFQEDGEAGLAPKPAVEGQFWNCIPEGVQQQIVQLALKHPDKSPRQLAWLYTDQEGYFVSESSVFRLLKGCNLIGQPAMPVSLLLLEAAGACL